MTDFKLESLVVCINLYHMDMVTVLLITVGVLLNKQFTSAEIASITLGTILPEHFTRSCYLPYCIHLSCHFLLVIRISVSHSHTPTKLPLITVIC